MNENLYLKKMLMLLLAVVVIAVVFIFPMSQFSVFMHLKYVCLIANSFAIEIHSSIII